MGRGVRAGKDWRKDTKYVQDLKGEGRSYRDGAARRVALVCDVAPSTSRSAGRSTGESLGRLLEQSLDRPIDGLLERPLDPLLDWKLERPHGRGSC